MDESRDHEAPLYPIRIEHLGYREAGREYNHRMHHHTCHQWYAVIAGDVTMCYDDDEFVLRAGEAILMAPGVDRAPRCSGQAPRYIVAQFWNRSLHLDGAIGQRWHLDEAAHISFGALVDEMHQPGMNAWHMRHALLVRLIIGHSRAIEHDQSDVASRLNTLSHHEVVGRAEEFLRAQMHRKVLRDEVAEAVHLSPTHVNRLFRQVLGKSINQRLVEIRMERARHLLLDSTLSISQISSEVGFSSFSHFARTFSQNFGVTPSDYRRSRGKSFVASD